MVYTKRLSFDNQVPTKFGDSNLTPIDPCYCRSSSYGSMIIADLSRREKKEQRRENHLLQWSFEVVVWLRKIPSQVKVEIITLCLRKFIDLNHLIVFTRYFNFNNPLFWFALDVRDSKESEELRVRSVKKDW